MYRLGEYTSLYLNTFSSFYIAVSKNTVSSLMLAEEAGTAITSLAMAASVEKLALCSLFSSTELG